MNMRLYNKAGYAIDITSVKPYWSKGQFGAKLQGQLHDPKGNVIELSEIEIQLDEIKAIAELVKKFQSGEFKFDEMADTLLKAIFNALKGAFAVALVGRKK